LLTGRAPVRPARLQEKLHTECSPETVIHDTADRHMTHPHSTRQRRLRAGRQLITAGLMLLLATSPVYASPFDHPLLLFAKRNHTENGGISLDEAVRRARQQHKGKVLSAETIRKDGRKVYRIKILTKNGRVKRVKIDARTGQIISRGR